MTPRSPNTHSRRIGQERRRLLMLNSGTTTRVAPIRTEFALSPYRPYNG